VISKNFIKRIILDIDFFDLIPESNMSIQIKILEKQPDEFEKTYTDRFREMNYGKMAIIDINDILDKMDLVILNFVKSFKFHF